MKGPARCRMHADQAELGAMDEQQTGTVRKTDPYTLVPPAEQEQEQALACVLRRCRELYNAGLQERRDAWQRCGVSVSITAARQRAQLPAIKEVRPEYCDVHSPTCTRRSCKTR